MNPHLRFDTLPALRDPALVCAFQGWNDGGEAASVAARYLMERWHAEPFARIDAEEFYDFQVNRPSVRLEDGVTRVIDWPSPAFAATSPPGRDVVFLTAPEPSVRWRAFTDAVLEACRELRVGLLVTLGGFLTDVPHAREVPVVGSARDRGEAERLGLADSRYEGPTGIVGVIHDAANRAGIASVSLWAAVPHYLPTAPNPKAALALVDRACSVLGTVVDADGLKLAVGRWERGVARLLEDNEELREYASRLETNADADDAEDDELSTGGAESAEEPEDLTGLGRLDGLERLDPLDTIDGLGELGDLGSERIPSRDELAAEVERFLRERAHGEPGDEA